MTGTPFGWGHINVNVSDLDRAAAFYEKLGFTPYRDSIPYLAISAETSAVLPAPCAEALGLPPETRARGCIMELGRGYPKLDLTEIAGGTPRPPPVTADLGTVRLCLSSQDLEADHVRLTEQGVPFLSAPKECHERLALIALCSDPDGTLIELIQVFRDRWPAPR